MRRFPASVLFSTMFFGVSVGTVLGDPLTYIGRAVLPGGPSAGQDFSFLPHTKLADNTEYQDVFDGFGSGLAYTGYGNRFLLLNDRGPNKVVYNASIDNTNDYKTRFQIADLTLTGSGNSYTVNVAPLATSLLTTTSGNVTQNFTGISTAFTGADPNLNLRLDPEGISVAKDGSVYISDEYGPVIYHFSQTGQRLDTIPVPAKFKIDNLFPTVATEISGNTIGRVGNKGMEGLTITPDNSVLLGAMQSPLLQDATETGVASNGTNVRFLKYDMAHLDAAPKELVYQLDNPANVISEVVAINSHQFLVDERDAVGGTSGGVKKLYLIDLNQAGLSDVSEIAQLQETGNTPGVTALSKTLFGDIGTLLRDAGALNGNSLPDKFEGYAFGPDLPDGRHTLFVTNDNDYSTTYPDYIFAFAIDQNYFADFQVRQLNEGVTFVPEPTCGSLICLGAAMLLKRRRA